MSVILSLTIISIQALCLAKTFMLSFWNKKEPCPVLKMSFWPIFAWLKMAKVISLCKFEIPNVMPGRVRLDWEVLVAWCKWNIFFKELELLLKIFSRTFLLFIKCFLFLKNILFCYFYAYIWYNISIKVTKWGGYIWTTQIGLIL